MSFSQSRRNYRVHSPSSSPPVPNSPSKQSSSSSGLKLLPSPPPSCSSSNSHLVAENDCHDLVWRAFEYVNHRTSESPGLLLPNFTWDDYDDFRSEIDTPRNISGKDADSLRYDYNPVTLTLRIPPMPKAGHNALEDFLTQTMACQARLNTLTQAEQFQIQLGFGTDMSLPFRATTLVVGRKAPAFAKQPDAFFKLRGSRSPFPRVVFEVAFSETYEEVLDDVNQWLIRSRGKVPLAVLIYIEEHPIPPATPLDVADEKVPEDAEDDDGNTSDTSADTDSSDPEMYERLSEACDTDRYVGKFSAFAEVYRYGPQGVYRVGARVNIISDPSVVPPAPAGRIQLSITDLLPHITDGRVIVLDLEMYASLLEHARADMALPRLLEERRRRLKMQGREQAVDADYNPAAEGGKRKLL